MKHLISFLAILLMPLMASAVQATDSVQVAMTGDNAPIIGQCTTYNRHFLSSYSSDGKIAALTCDTTKAGAIAKTGAVAVYDMATMQELWHYDVNPKKTKLLGFVKNCIMISSSQQDLPMLLMKNASTGEVVWSKDVQIVHYDDSLNIVFAYNRKKPAIIYAIDASNGNELWNVKTPSKGNFGWNSPVHIGNNRLIVVSDDINSIDLKTGALKQIKAKTYVNDSKASWMMALSGFAGSLLGTAMVHALGPSPYYVYPYTTAGSIISGITSNTLCHGDRIYISDRERLRCFDKNTMDVVWEHQFPKSYASKAKLVMNNGKLYMLNLGYGTSSTRGIVKCGRPFVASFNPETGQQETSIELFDKKQVVEDMHMTDNGIFFITDNKAGYLSLDDNKMETKEFETIDINGWFCDIIADSCIYKKENTENSLTPLTPSNDYCNILNRFRSITVIDRSLNVVNTFSPKHLYIKNCADNDLTCMVPLSIFNDILLIHNDGTVAARVHEKPEAIFLKNNYYIAVCKNRIMKFHIE